MLHPMPGYVLAKIKDKTGKIVLPDNLATSQYKEITVIKAPKDCEIKKGAEIFLKANTRLSFVEKNKTKYYVISLDDIIAYDQP